MLFLCQWLRSKVTGYRGVDRVECKGHLPHPGPLFSQSCVIFIIFTVVFRVKNDHRMADYKAISKQTLSYTSIEQCLVTSLKCLMSSEGIKIGILQIVWFN